MTEEKNQPIDLDVKYVKYSEYQQHREFVLKILQQQIECNQQLLNAINAIRKLFI